MRVNLGASEQVLLSERRPRLDDLVWHSVELSCVRGNIYLVIDRHHETTGHIPGGKHNLHFQHGVYLAGHGVLDVFTYMDSSPVSVDVWRMLYSVREILTFLQSYPGFKKVFEVSLRCSDEFFAEENKVINFFTSRSYVTFPEWRVQGEGLLGFALQTESQQALLLFQSGKKGNFVALEIVKGLLKAHVRGNKNNTQLSSFSFVSDNKWHLIQLKLTGRYLDLMVDDQEIRMVLPLQSRPFVSEGPLYMGSLDNSKEEQVKKLALASVPRKSPEISFKGCLRGLEANSEKRALKDAFVSKDVSAGCKMKGSDNANPL